MQPFSEGTLRMCGGLYVQLLSVSAPFPSDPGTPIQVQHFNVNLMSFFILLHSVQKQTLAEH